MVLIYPFNILLAIKQYHKTRNNSQTLIPTSAVESPNFLWLLIYLLDYSIKVLIQVSIMVHSQMSWRAIPFSLGGLAKTECFIDVSLPEHWLFCVECLVFAVITIGNPAGCWSCHITICCPDSGSLFQWF